MQYQSALMSWRDHGFDLEKLNNKKRDLVQNVFERLSGKFGAVSVEDISKNEIIKDIQKIEQSLRDSDAQFYYNGTVYNSDLQRMDYSQYPQKWVDLVAEEELTDLNEIKKLIKEIDFIGK